MSCTTYAFRCSSSLLSSRLGWKDEEFIALGVSHDRPPHAILRIADLAEHTGTQTLEALQFCPVGHININMPTVFHDLRLRYLIEPDAQASGWRMDGYGKVWGVLWRGWSERIPQHRGPEAGHAVGVGTVETDVTEVRGRHRICLRLCTKRWSVPPLGSTAAEGVSVQATRDDARA